MSKHDELSSEPLRESRWIGMISYALFEGSVKNITSRLQEKEREFEKRGFSDIYFSHNPHDGDFLAIGRRMETEKEVEGRLKSAREREERAVKSKEEREQRELQLYRKLRQKYQWMD